MSTVRESPHVLPRSRRGPQLVISLLGKELVRGGASLDLEGIREVTFGRGPKTLVEFGKESCHVALADPEVSSKHAVLRRQDGDDGSFELVDLGSTNGVYRYPFTPSSTLARQGPLASPATLSGEACFTLGSVAFHLMTRAHTTREPRSIVWAEDMPGHRDGLTTFLPSYADRLTDLIRFAATELNICILGEVGTERVRLAQAVHAWSKRSGHEMVDVNAARLLAGEFVALEAMLRDATHSTILLHDLDGLEPTLQRALSQMLEAAGTLRTLTSVAGEELGMIPELASHLTGFVFKVMPLRDRMVDLGTLVLRALGSKASQVTLAPEAVRMLVQYTYPANTDELGRALVAASELCFRETEGVVQKRHLPFQLGPVTVGGEPLDRRGELVKCLQDAEGNLSEVARNLRTSRSQVHRWLERFGLSVDDYRRNR